MDDDDADYMQADDEDYDQEEGGSADVENQPSSSLSRSAQRVWRGGINHYVTILILGMLVLGGVISLGVANYLVLLQVWQLWEQRAGIRLLLTLDWGISYSVTLIVGCLVIVDLYNVVEPVAGFNISRFTPIPGLVRVICYLMFNAIDRPRPADVSLASSLYRDGVLYFLSLSILRILNLVITWISPTPFVHVRSTPIWECDTVAFNRYHSLTSATSK
ncbi:hypothetical protein AURDEDRAFT_165196 [Auricularia subglabra TFB-10046 SS5]|nr:hypothetical protein AURDEDRAFT_165196 [Auricularia subglabra TFB-10046 SS5]